MIRRRVASLDDSIIYRMIIKELVPFARKSNPAVQYSLQSIRKRLNRNVTLVAARGNRSLFGFITMICKNKVLFVDMLAVDSRFHGKGWGRLLMSAAEQYGKSKGCRTAQLFVDDSNPKAISFYQARGYQLVQFVAQVHCFLMEKPL